LVIMRGLWRLPGLVAAAGLSVIGVLAFDAIAGPGGIANPQKAGGEVRAIFTKESAREAWSWLLRPQQEFWTPTLSEVLELEARLPAYLRSPEAKKAAEGCCPQPVPLSRRAPAYKRQYVGVLDHGRLLIHANFFCEAPAHDWHRTPVVVDDGGDCYFQVDYDVRKRRFESIAVNGGA
jgi:hypothetical protein